MRSKAYASVTQGCLQLNYTVFDAGGAGDDGGKLPSMEGEN